ncbi:MULTISPECIES: hypothetical protein [unclassified Acidisoma]|jgi:hypothetical protein|uniref:hypothetical protein n=1 Tax=unclassified Acidisoma TaxID=2634065 RepID=UPI00131DB244|nr:MULTISPECIES: hypothetical protein [unclassified Acidisoma]
MRPIHSLVFAAALALAPPAASFAASGSDVSPATTRAAVAGPVSNKPFGETKGYSLSPTNGAAGGGMASSGGIKAGGQSRQLAVTTSTAG